MTNITEKSFTLVLMVLRFAGLYSNQNKSRLRIIWSYITYSFLVYVVASSALEILYEENLDEMKKNQLVLTLIVTGSGSFKILPLYTRRNKIKKCIDYFADERFTPKNKVEKKILDDCVQICRRNVALYWSVVLSDLMLWCVFTFFGKDQTLPVSFLLPYDYKSNFGVFSLTFIVISLGVFYVNMVSQGIEPLLGGLIYHGMCQIRILKHNLQNADENGKVFEILQRCILHHNDILNFFKEFEGCFSFLIFSQIAGTTFNQCYCLIGIITSPAGSNFFMMYGGVYLASSFQILLYCYFGTLLFEEYERLMTTIYMSRWYEYDARSKKLLLTIMENSKKPLILTAGKIVDLTLATYTTILKTGYSLIAVLNNTY